MLSIQIDTKNLELVIYHQFNNIKLSFFASHMKSGFPLCRFDRCCTIIRCTLEYAQCCCSFCKGLKCTCQVFRKSILIRSVALRNCSRGVRQLSSKHLCKLIVYASLVQKSWEFCLEGEFENKRKFVFAILYFLTHQKSQKNNSEFVRTNKKKCKIICTQKGNSLKDVIFAMLSMTEK